MPLVGADLAEETLKRLREFALWYVTGGESEDWPEWHREEQLELIRRDTLDARAADATCVASSVYKRMREPLFL